MKVSIASTPSEKLVTEISEVSFDALRLGGTSKPHHAAAHT